MAIKLARLPVNWKDQPELFERYWDESMTSIEKTLNAILKIPAIEAALKDLDDATAAASAAAAAANLAAGNANATALAAKSEASLVNSYVSNFTAPLISSGNTGDITVVKHDRVYGDSTLNPTVSVDGNTLTTGAPMGAVVRVYYQDALREGGAVTYQFTVDPAAPPVQGGNIHSVGTAVIPETGTDEGNYIKPPGYVGRQQIEE